MNENEEYAFIVQIDTIHAQSSHVCVEFDEDYLDADNWVLAGAVVDGAISVIIKSLKLKGIEPTADKIVEIMSILTGLAFERREKMEQEENQDNNLM